MKMHWIDWLIVGIPFLVVVWAGLKGRRHVKGVSDFLAGSRCAGRYLLTTADGIAGMGLITMVAYFEMYYKSGYAFGWWGQISIPIFLLLTLTGYIVYRYRETRVMTLAQFFEVRYSKRFRIFTGFIIALSGVVNYGIFPAVSGRFFLYFCGFPESVSLLGYQVPTLAILMAIFLSTALALTLLGGQLTVMITDTVQGLFTNVMIVVIAFYMVYSFGFTTMIDSLSHRPPGESFLDPFDTFKLKDFNIWFVLIGIFGGVYSIMTWQGNQGYNCAALNAHEAKMSKVLGYWRGGAQTTLIMLMAVCAYAYMHHPNYAGQAEEVQAVVRTIDSSQIQEQMTVPIAISKMLPPGLTGIFAAIALFFMISTDTTYLHSWGSIIIQDVVLPFRKKPFTPRQHLWLLRLSIIGVAVFAFWFSLLFQQTEYILMFFALTGAIWGGGAGAVLAGGLYWKKGTTAGAWVALIVGSTIAVGGILLEQCWKGICPVLMSWFPHFAYLAEHQDKFPINGQWMFFISMTSSVVCYVTVSLLTCREDFDMDRMLHRGRYAAKDDSTPVVEKPPRSLKKYLGIDERFSKGDRILSYSVFCYTMYTFAVWLGITLINLLWFRWPLKWWAYYTFYYGIPLALVIGLVTTVWFTVGGVIDLRRLFQRLNVVERNVLDSGMVVGHHNLGEEAGDEAILEEAPAVEPAAGRSGVPALGTQVSLNPDEEK